MVNVAGDSTLPSRKVRPCAKNGFQPEWEGGCPGAVLGDRQVTWDTSRTALVTQGDAGISGSHGSTGSLGAHGSAGSSGSHCSTGI